MAGQEQCVRCKRDFFGLWDTFAASGAAMRWRLSASALLAVSFVKAAGYQDAHGADSDSADEQQFVVNEVIALQRTPDWRSTVVIVAYDDEDVRIVVELWRRPPRVIDSQTVTASGT